MTVCIYRYIHTTALYYWPNTTGMTHVKVKMYLHAFLKLALDGVSHTITVCLITTPYTLPNPVLHTVWSSAPPFNFQYLLVFLRSYSSCLHHLPRLLITSIFGWILVLLYTQKNATSIYWTRDMTVSSVGVAVIQFNSTYFAFIWSLGVVTHRIWNLSVQK